MTHFLNHYTLKYTPLSPVHIGTDESYEPGNYVIDEEAGALYSFDSGAALAGLSDSERKDLLAIVNNKPDDTMLTKVQAFFHKYRGKLIAYAMPPVPTATGVNSLYDKRIGKSAQQEGYGRRVINKLEIERTFYNPVDGKPLLPGSSIKGAIRTALLDGINNEKRLIERNERNQQLQQRLFDGKFHTDPMRLVSIADASWQGSTDKPACQVQFAVNRKRKPVFKDGKLMQSQAEASNLYQLLECVVPHHYQSFTGSLTLHNTQSIEQNNAKLPKQQFHWTAKEIAKACNNFYVGLFWQELHAIKERGYINTAWLNQMEQLLDNGLSKRLLDGDAFMLRVGRHSGAEALTLNGIRNIRIMQGKGQPAVWASQPKTWWLAADDISNKQDMLPFGWVLVEINPKVPDSPLQNWLENGNSALIQWMQQELEKQNALKQKADVLKQQEHHRLQAELQLAVELRLKQEAEEKRRGTMTEQQLQIETLTQHLQQKQAANVREQIGGPLYSAMRELINQTSSWTVEDKTALLNVAKQILELIGAGSNKKAKELLKNLQ